MDVKKTIEYTVLEFQREGMFSNMNMEARMQVVQATSSGELMQTEYKTEMEEARNRDLGRNTEMAGARA